MSISIQNKGEMRSGEVVIRSMITTQAACVLTCIAPQLVIILNSLIVSRFLGSACFKAISAFNPVTVLVLLLINICCIGPSVQAGTAYGKFDLKSANRMLTLSGCMAFAVSIIPALALLVFRTEIAGRMISDSGVSSLLNSYLGPLWLYLLLSAGVSLLNSFVTAAGYASKVTGAVMVSGTVNVLSVFLLVKVFQMGIEAAAIAMCLASITNILILIPIVFRRRFPFRFTSLGPNVFSILRKNILFWIGINFASLSNAVLQFITNILILHFLSSEGLFIWGICLIAISVPSCFTAGICDAYVYVDGFLLGEGDSTGRLKMAKFFLKELCAIILFLTIIFICFSDHLSILFGADSVDLVRSVRVPLVCTAIFTAFREIFSTFGVFSIQRRPSVKIGYSIVSCIAPCTLIFISAVLLGPGSLWYGFAASTVFIVAFVVLSDAHYRRKDRNLIPYFLFDRLGEAVSYDVSVEYSAESVKDNLDRIRKFLQICEISDSLFSRVEICCGELMNCVLSMETSGKTFDLRLSDSEDCLGLFVSNVGKPAAPVLSEGIADGVRMDYHYVHGMNVAFLKFDKSQE